MSAGVTPPEGQRPGSFGPEEFAAATGVSRETLDRLTRYHALLGKWQARINLIGPDTLPQAWHRHFLDSAQVFPHVQGRVLYDFGSGAGFPGLVLAVMATGSHRPLEVHLVESDARKAAFLADVSRETGLAKRVTIHATRIERLPIERLPKADTVTARALAPLTELLAYAAPLLAPTGQCLFLKGARAMAELTEARKTWTMRADSVQSRTDAEGRLLRISGLARGSSATG